MRRGKSTIISDAWVNDIIICIMIWALDAMLQSLFQTANELFIHSATFNYHIMFIIYHTDDACQFGAVCTFT